MGKTNKKALEFNFDCRKFKHLSMLTLCTLVLSFSVSAKDNKNDNKNDINEELRRSPAAIEEEVLTLPFEKEAPTMDVLFSDDDAGIMKEMKATVDSWEKTEEFASVWSLESTHLYDAPDTHDKTKYLTKKMFRYADKRLSGEMKNAEAGSTMYKVGKAEKSLRPNASVPVNKYIALKFKARVLQGKATVEVRNPWLETNATVSANGSTRLVAKKDFKDIGFSSGAEFSIKESEWIAFMDQAITENIKARISSTQESHEAIFSNGADARAEITASFPFNL
jgi:hypothetical protein